MYLDSPPVHTAGSVDQCIRDFGNVWRDCGLGRNCASRTAPFSRMGRRHKCFFFGIPMVVFGIQHFMYGRFAATLVPSWIPGRLFCSVFCRCRLCRRRGKYRHQKAGTFGSDSVGHHVFSLGITSSFPRVAAASHNGDEWTSAFVALAMCGGAWIVAGTMPKKDKT
jgi:hypothetical protein